MKISFFLTTFSLTLISSSMFAAGDPAYGKCSFACKEIPKAEDVLYSMGKPTLNELPSTRVKALVWNIYKGKDKEFAKTFDLLAKNKDLVLLSEVINASPVSTSLAKQAGFGWDMAASFLMKDKVATGTAVGSKVVAHDVRFYRTKDVEPFVKSPKTTTIAEYRIPGRSQTLMILSIHGINWSGNDALERQLNMILPDLQQHQGPILFAGDFNTKNDDRLNAAKVILAKAGLTRIPWENPNKGKQLDDGFSRGLSFKKARLINDYIDKASDHPALDLEFDLLP